MTGTNRFSLSVQDGTAVLAVQGEFDLDGADAFRRSRAEALRSASPIVVDLTECEFIDSTGLGVLIDTYQVAERVGLRMALVGSGIRVHRLLELTGVAERVPCFTSIEEARAKLFQTVDGHTPPT